MVCYRSTDERWPGGPAVSASSHLISCHQRCGRFQRMHAPPLTMAGHPSDQTTLRLHRDEETFRPSQRQGRALEQHPGANDAFVSLTVVHTLMVVTGAVEDNQSSLKTLTRTPPIVTWSTPQKVSTSPTVDVAFIHDVPLGEDQSIDNSTVARTASLPFGPGGLHDRKDGDRQSPLRSLLQCHRRLCFRIKIVVQRSAASSHKEIGAPA